MVKKIKSWQTLSAKLILDHDQAKLTEDKVLLPNGHEATYVRYVPSANHAVIIIAINAKKEVLIQREYSYPPNKIMWQLPGGSMKKRESVKQAALRELAEESGYSAKNTEVIGQFYIHNRTSDKKQYIVVCKGLYEHKLPEDKDEFIENYWLSKRKLKQKIASGEFDNINLLAALNVWFSQGNS